MKWFIDKLIELVSFPIQWFWDKFEEYRDYGTIWNIILLFMISFGGLVLIVGSLAWLMLYLYNNHIELIVIVGLVIWLYAYFKSKRDKKDSEDKNKKDEQEKQFKQAQEMAHAQAQSNYPLMRNIMYQTLKTYAENIGCVRPRLLQEIEVVDAHYVLANGICFYQFKLTKADIKAQYNRWDLMEFEISLQEKIARKVKNGEFPALGTQTYLDATGQLYDAINIDIIEDIGQYFIIQAVFYSPAYADYWRGKEINLQSNSSDTTIPDAEWKDNK